MPLVTITGIPCSGKSTVAKNIKEHLEKSQKKVIIVSEDELLEQNEMDKNIVLNDSIKEKTLRSDLKGQVLRHLSKDTVVVLDALNYIKGYRYELYCASKSVKTTQITVHCDISPPNAWNWTTLETALVNGKASSGRDSGRTRKRNPLPTNCPALNS